MGLLEDELSELRRIVERVVPDSTLEACVPAMVRVNIQRNKYKQIVACFQFPKTYPNETVLTELKSRHISDKLLDGLTGLCEKEARNLIGKPQVLSILKFVRKFLDDNPLCCCSEEIAELRQKLRAGTDEVKLKQKNSSISLKISEGAYNIKYNIIIPEDYPDHQVRIEEKDCNYPSVFKRWFLAQSQELARQCVEPPAKKKPKDPPFVRKPSLLPVASFLLDEAHRYPCMECPVCRKVAFPSNPNDIPDDQNSPNHVERIYCGHIYHNECLDTYIRTPPFLGGKKCHVCGLVIYHDKWKLTPKVAEERWAHAQAKQRELDEVVDFLS